MQFSSTDSKSPKLRPRIATFLVIIVIGVLADLLTKDWIFAKLGMPGEKPQWWIIDGVFGFQTSLNQGALFGMGQGNVVFFAIFSFVAIVGILVWLFFFRGFESWFLSIVFGMVSAGILGNLYDRLGLHKLRWNYTEPSFHEIDTPVYAVRDWILVMIGDWPWPNFNIADSLLVCGAILLATYAIFTKDETATTQIS